MRVFFFVISFICLRCIGKNDKPPLNIKGIWIPRKVDWKDGSFETYYFKDDSTVVIISSVQKKLKDSILFNTESGFIIKKGEIKKINSKFLITYRVIYRYVKIVGEGNKLFTEKITIEPNGKSISINEVLYQPGDLYTKDSKERIEIMATRMVSDIEAHPERFN